MQSPLEIALAAAAQHRGAHPYIPDNIENFQPHPWVLLAIEIGMEQAGKSPLTFAYSFAALQEGVHRNAVDKGFWKDDCCDGKRLNLIHSELSEATEALRDGTAHTPSRKIPLFNCLEEELADAVIRIMDFAQARGLSLGPAIVAKIEYNTSRPHMHGKAF